MLDHDCRQRVSHIQMIMRETGLDGVLIQDRVSLFYYFNTIPGGSGYIPQNGEPLLLVRRGQGRVARESPYSAVNFGSFRDLPAIFDSHGWSGHRRIGLELDRLPVALFTSMQKYMAGCEFQDVSGHLRLQRAVKSPREQAILREAGRLAAKAYEQLPSLLQQAGRRELDVMADFEAVMRKLGHQGYVRLHAFNGEIYYGAFAAGESANATITFDGPVGTPGLSAAAPFLCSDKVIGPHEPVMVDVVFGFQGYLVDQTRVFSRGSLPDSLVAAHALAVYIQDAIAARLKPGESGEELYNLSLLMAKQEGLAEQFMGFGDNRVSFVGHGIGLEVDELPVLAPRFTTPLASGMVIAVEPKFFFDRLGAVGIENTYIVTENGGEKLTPFPDDLVILPE